MYKFFRKLLNWLYVKFHTVFIMIGIALHNTEVDILKADPNDLQEKDKRVQRMLHRNQLLEKFYAGQRDEKYVQDFYEILKRADVFLRTSTPHQIAVAIGKYFRFSGTGDGFGDDSFEHGFFDEKHKYSGKTLEEVFELEKRQRRTDDDDYELLYIFNNKPIDVGLGGVIDFVEEKNGKLVVVDHYRKSKSFKFPIEVFRDDENVLNKIEELTEFLHVKKIGLEYRQLEFFIPLHFKTNEIEDNSPIFNEIKAIKSVYVKDEYGKLIGFRVDNFLKRIVYKNLYEVWKFEGIEMETVGVV